MKLLTHNMLTSHVRGLKPGGGFPLQIQASEVRVRPVPFNADFVARLVPRLHWAALLQAAESLPPEPSPGYEEDEAFLRRLHHLLLEVEVLEGVLQCPDSGRRFPISRGVPNMLLSEEET
ncbi:multifunctional methyltransferase subunit TRM112-like protein isoform X2 [Indicator indicator]|uniref:multifunctional methyltransferase subunit TRM112-like protein isoform X2 n=1 Tax=Indicator indicator TaxID=1002788 RepID=UPI0023DFBC4E|nr:multifunctional methyltransferase subunit TRM112-like protein isoform X2 [Indicator indicator]